MSADDQNGADVCEADIIARFERIKAQQPSLFNEAIGATEREGVSHGKDPSPLSSAVESRHHSLVRYLLLEGTRLFQGYPSHIAATDGCVSYFRLLYEMRGELVAVESLGWHTDGDGMTALARAAASGRLEFVQWAFKEHGVRLLSYWEPRHAQAHVRAAAASGSVDMLRFVFSAVATTAGADKATVSDWAAYALLPAALSGSQAVLSFALSHADPARRSFTDMAASVAATLTSRAELTQLGDSHADTLAWFLATISPAAARAACSCPEVIGTAAGNANARVCELLVGSGADPSDGLYVLLFPDMSDSSPVYAPPSSASVSRVRATMDALLTHIPGACVLARLRGSKAACEALSPVVCRLARRFAASRQHGTAGHAAQKPTETLLRALIFAADNSHLPSVELLAALLAHHFGRGLRLFGCLGEGAYQAKARLSTLWNDAIVALVGRMANNPGSAEEERAPPSNSLPVMPALPPLTISPGSDDDNDAGDGPSCAGCCGLDDTCAHGCVGVRDEIDIAIARVAAVLVPLAAAAHAEVRRGGPGSMPAAVGAFRHRRPNVLWVLQQSGACKPADVISAALEQSVPAPPGVSHAAWCARLSACVRVLLPVGVAVSSPDALGRLLIRSAVSEGNVAVVRLLFKLDPHSTRDAAPLHVMALGAVSPTPEAFAKFQRTFDVGAGIAGVVHDIVRRAREAQSHSATEVWDQQTAAALRGALHRVVSLNAQYLWGSWAAQKWGPESIAGVLLRAGADPYPATDDPSRETVLHSLMPHREPNSASIISSKEEFRRVLRDARSSPLFARTPMVSALETRQQV